MYLTMSCRLLVPMKLALGAVVTAALLSTVAPAPAGVHGTLAGTGHVSPSEFRATTYGTPKWVVQRDWGSVGKLVYQWSHYGTQWREKRYRSTVNGSWVEAYYAQVDGVWRLRPDLQWCNARGCSDTAPK